MAQEFSTTFIFPVSVGRSLELGVGFCGGLLFVLLGFCGGWVVLALEMLPWLELCLEPVICLVLLSLRASNSFVIGAFVCHDLKQGQ